MTPPAEKALSKPRAAATMAGQSGSRPPWYHSSTLVSGLVLTILGLGNWITGSVRLRESVGITEAVERADSLPGPSPHEDAEILELARARTDFYHVVSSGGRLMTGAGFVLGVIGLVRRRLPRAPGSQRETDRAVTLTRSGR